MNRSQTLVALCISTSFIGSASAGVIGLDNRNGHTSESLLGSSSRFDQFREVITSMGHSIVLLTDFNDLSGLDSIFINQPTSFPQRYSDLEMGAINSFVASGGGMLAHSDAATASNAHVGNMNQTISPFNASFSSEVYNTNGLVVGGFIAHAVTQGISQIGVDYNRKVIVSGDTIDLTGDSSDILAARDGINGQGNIVFLSDTTLWSDPDVGADYGIEDLGNELLLRNIINYTIPAPSSLALLGFGALTIRRRR